MVTENQADVWLGQQVGQHLDYDHVYGQQCVDFFNFYYQFISGDNPYSDGYGVNGAKDLWDRPNDRFDKIPDSNNLIPNVGDVLVYGASWGGGYGHVEVCRWSDAGGCHVIGENEHNNSNEGVVEVYRSWASMRGLIGVMRPNFSPEPQPTPPPAPEPTPDPTPVEPTPQPEEPSEPTQDPTPTPDPVETPPADPAPTPDVPTESDSGTPSSEVPAKPVVVSTPSKWEQLFNAILAFLKQLFNKKG